MGLKAFVLRQETSPARISGRPRFLIICIAQEDDAGQGGAWRLSGCSEGARLGSNRGRGPRPQIRARDKGQR